MAIACSNCGAEAEGNARFCSACGAPLDPALGAERKVATMVFADLVGSTEMASGLDPELLRRKLAPFFETARASLAAHGGTIEKYVGDAVLAVFGVPASHGDDPDRAVAAALDLSAQVSALEAGLAVRIGVETGEVLAADREGDLSVTGEAVNIAARLQQAAAPGEVLVGERAARACRLARLEPAGPIEAKGLAKPLATWRAADRESNGSKRTTPMVGRDDDLELLRLVYRRGVREQAPQLVTIVGDAGIGKTRLANEMLDELRGYTEAPRVLIGRNPPYGRGIAFWALGEILRDAAGADSDDPVDRVESSLAALLADLGADDGAEIAKALTVALRGEQDGAGVNAEEELKGSWRRFVALLAAERPLVIAIEDAHWADDGLLDLLEEVAFGIQEARLLLLLTSRPELIERRPDFGRSIRSVTQLELRPLGEAAAINLVELLLPDAEANIASRVAQASGGNPFFAEEVSRNVEQGESTSDRRLPDTVQAAIAARMDQLPVTEKRALQQAAVLGQNFREDGLANLLGEDPGPALAALRQKALIEERPASGPGRFAFRHQLIRDVAYSALPKTQRAELHEVAAARLRDSVPERRIELAELIAFHLEHAAELDPAPGRSGAARLAITEAAEAAAGRGATARAQELYEDAAGFAEEPSQRVRSLHAAGDVALRRWRGDEGLRLMRLAAEAAEESGEPDIAAAAYARAVEVGSRMRGISGDVSDHEVEQMQERGRELVGDDDLVTIARLRLNDHWIAWARDCEEDMREPAEEGLELARKAGDVAVLSAGLDAVTATDWMDGHHRKAVGHTRERIEMLAKQPRSPMLEVERSDALHMMIECLLQTGEFREAETFAIEAREGDLSRGLVYSGWQRGILPAFYLGHWDEVDEMAVRVRDAWIAAGRPPIGAFKGAVGAVAAIHGYRGDEEAMREWFDLADAIDSGRASAQTMGIQMMQADVRIHQGRFEEAAAELQSTEGGFWWKWSYLATRAEAMVLAGDPGAADALEMAIANFGDHRYAEATVLRARGIAEGDESLLRRSLALFQEIEAPYQAARSGWMLGGPERRDARLGFEALGATLPKL